MNAVATANRKLGEKTQNITLTLTDVDGTQIGYIYGDIDLFKNVKPASASATDFTLEALNITPSNDSSHTVPENSTIKALISLTITDTESRTYKTMNFPAYLNTGNQQNPISYSSVVDDINTAFKLYQKSAPPTKLEITDNKVFVDSIIVKYIE